MKIEDLQARRYVFVDLAIIEIFNPDNKVWEYYISRKDKVDLKFSFLRRKRISREELRELWKKGYFAVVCGIKNSKKC